MDDVTVAYAKEHLEELIERVRRGEDVRITDSNQGTVHLSAEPRRGGKVRLGQWRKLPEIPEERLLAPLEDSELAWLSGETSPARR